MPVATADSTAALRVHESKNVELVAYHSLGKRPNFNHGPGGTGGREGLRSRGPGGWVLAGTKARGVWGWWSRRRRHHPGYDPPDGHGHGGDQAAARQQHVQ